MPIRVLVVDDSALMRSIIVNMLSTDTEISVVGVARDGVEAVEISRSLTPDVITLDIEMPNMNGLEALKRIMKERSAKVVMLSSLSSPEMTYEAIHQGAIDFVAKPSGAPLVDAEEFAKELIFRVKTAATVNPAKLRADGLMPKVKRRGSQKALFMNKVVAIGSSTGGPRALETVLRTIPEGLSASLLIVQHLPPGFSKALAERLDDSSRIPVKEAESGDPILPGVALIAPAGSHMVIADDQGQARVQLIDGPRLWGVKPAVDNLMVAVADHFKSRSVGVLLSGMGVDGANGMSAIKKRYGHTIVQNEETSIVYGMPKAAVEKGCVDEILPIGDIGRQLAELCARKVAMK